MGIKAKSYVSGQGAGRWNAESLKCFRGTQVMKDEQNLWIHFNWNGCFNAIVKLFRFNLLRHADVLNEMKV